MPVTMLRSRLIIAALAATIVFAVIAACGGDDDTSATPDGSESPAGSIDPSATVTLAPTPGGDPLIPPLEGPEPGPPVTEEKDWREDPEWALPRPEDVEPADDPDNPLLNPPSDPTCPPDWVPLLRPAEGYQMCYPVDWVTGSHGYVSSANESRWYALGLYDFSNPEEQIQRAHVSVYMFPTFSRPVRYTLDCPNPLSVTLSGLAAVMCEDFPGISPESQIVSYHVFREDRDYFLNIVSYFEYDEETGEYTDEVDQQAFDLAVQVAQTFKFIEITEIPTLEATEDADAEGTADEDTPTP